MSTTMTAQAPDIAPLIYTILSLALGLAALLFYHRRKQFAEHAAREQARLEQQQSQPRAARINPPAVVEALQPSSSESIQSPAQSPRSVQPTRDQLRDIRQARYAATSTSSSQPAAAPSPSLQPQTNTALTANKGTSDSSAAPAAS